MNDLGRLLDQAVPEPPRQFDPAGVLAAARRRRRARGAWTSVAATGLAAVLGLSLLPALPTADRSDLDPADVPLRLSALDRRVPLGGDAKGAVEVEPLRHPGEASLVATVEGYDIYLAERQDGEVCLVAENEGSTGSNCTSKTDLLAEEGLTLVVQEWDGRPATLVVAVPDGYDRAELGAVAAPVVANVAALPVDRSASTVTLSGPAVPDVTLDVSFRLGALDLGPEPGGAASRTQTSARAALLDLARSAQRYAEEHGTTTGFADALVAEQGPAVRRQMAELTDTTAVARVSPGSCLSVVFTTGRVTEAKC